MFNNSDELLKFIKDEGVEMIDVRFCDLPGIMQHFTVPASSFDQSVFDDGLGFDGSSIRGFQAINESDMSLFPDPTTAYLDPFRKSKTLNVNFFIHDPITGEAYSRDPRNIAAQGAGLPRLDRHRGHRLLRARGRVLHLRQRPLQHRRQRGLLPHRLRRGLVELRPGRRPEQGLQDPPQGRLLPRRALRPLQRPARRHGQEPRGLRPARRACPPRGRHRRPGGDQLPLRHAAQGRRRRDEVQVPHQEHRLGPGQVGHLHAQADLRRQRLGHARAPVAVEGRRAAVLRRDRATPACPTWPAGTSAASSSTPRRCWPSPTRR